jgi:hypothetical protein
VNSFEVALLRILVKKRAPVKLSTLVEGFPDGDEDSVLEAITSLRLKGYLDLTEYRPDGLVSLIKDKQREVVKIVSMNIDLRTDTIQTPYVEDHPTLGHSTNVPEKNNIKIMQVSLLRRRVLSTTFGRLAITTAVIIGLFGVIAVGGLPSTSSPNAGSQTAAIHYHYYYHGHYHQHSGYNMNDNANTMQASYDGHQPIFSSFLALKNCSREETSSNL